MKRVCFIGASIMEGMGDEAKLGMPGRLALLEAKSETPFIHYNLGIRGQTLREISARAVNECKSRLLNIESDFIVFATGSNDFAITDTGIPRTPRHRATKQFRDLIAQLKNLAPLLVLGPTPVDENKMPFLSIQSGMSFDFKNKDLAEGAYEYKDICSQHEIPFLDLHRELIKDLDYMEGLRVNDGLHSIGKGYQAMALAVYRSPQWKDLLLKNPLRQTTKLKSGVPTRP